MHGFLQFRCSYIKKKVYRKFSKIFRKVFGKTAVGSQTFIQIFVFKESRCWWSREGFKTKVSTKYTIKYLHLLGRDWQRKFLSVALLPLHNCSYYDICVVGLLYPNHRVHCTRPRKTMDHNQHHLVIGKITPVSNRVLNC